MKRVRETAGGEMLTRGGELQMSFTVMTAGEHGVSFWRDANVLGLIVVMIS